MNTIDTLKTFDDFLVSEDEELKLYKGELERSRLYNITPEGLVTYRVESLHSYLTRLGEKHQVSVWKLLEKEASEFFSKKFIKDYIKMRQTNHVHYINGSSEITEDYLKVLEILTKRDDLNNLTLLNGRGLFGAKRNILKKYRAWCPDCLTVWKKNEKEIYEPLMWNIKYINYCSEHLVKLQDECHSCGNKNRMLSSRQIVGCCGKCGEWLGGSQKKEVETLNDWDSWCILNFQELLKFFQKSSFMPLGHYSSNIIKMLVDQYTDGNANEFSGLLKVGMIKDYISARHNITFENLLKLSFYFKTSIVDLINFKPIDKCKINYSAMVRIENKQHKYYDVDPSELRKELREILDSNKIPPLSMAQVIRFSKYSSYILYKHGKDLCEEITYKRKLYLKEQKMKKRNELKEKVNNVVWELLNEGVEPTGWFVFNRLEEKVFKEDLEEILDEVLKDRNIKNE